MVLILFVMSSLHISFTTQSCHCQLITKETQPLDGHMRTTQRTSFINRLLGLPIYPYLTGGVVAILKTISISNFFCQVLSKVFKVTYPGCFDLIT